MLENSIIVSKLNEFANKNPKEAALLGIEENLNWHDLQQSVQNFKNQLQPFINTRTLLFISNSLVEQIPFLISISQINGEFILISSYHTLDRAKELMIDFDASNVIGVKDNTIQILAQRPPTQTSDYNESLLGILTSGTTGAPKCARYSWGRLSQAVVINPKFQGRKWMMSYHITNFAGLQVFLQCFLNGGCFVIPKTWPSDWSDDVKLIENLKVDYLNCTATYSRKLTISMTQPHIKTVKGITLGGEIVEQPLIDDLKKKFPNAKIIHIYASTEMGARVEVKDEQAGFPLALINDIDIRIFENEIQLKPSNRSMLSYLQKKDIDFDSEAQGWISTGDIVEIRTDRVYFLGRKDLMINVGGFKVNPTIVEAVIRNCSGVQDVLVSGLKNPISGNLVKATIVPSAGVDPSALRPIILELCKLKLPYYSVPRVLEFIDHLALTSSSKIKRNG